MRDRVLLTLILSIALQPVTAIVSRAAGNGAGGVIRGTVRLMGNAPAIAQVAPEDDLDVCGIRSRPAQMLVLGTNQCVQDVIIYLEDAATKDRPQTLSAPVVLDQRNCEFTPRIQIAASGAPLILKNSDPVLHVVRIDSLTSTNGPKTLLTVATPYAGFEKKYQLANFSTPTLLRATNLNGHNWMVGYIAVMPHPWVARTDAAGGFSISDVPAGVHKLYAWHEVLGTMTREIKVSTGRTVVVDMEFSEQRAARAQ